MKVRAIGAVLATATAVVLVAGCSGGDPASGSAGGAAAPTVRTVDEVQAALQKAGLCPHPEVDPGFAAVDHDNPGYSKVTKTVLCGRGTTHDVTVSGFKSTADRDLAASHQPPSYDPYVGTGGNLWVLRITADQGVGPITRALGASQMKSLESH